MTEDQIAALYGRVSTPGQEADGTSLDSQEAACRAYAAEHGYRVDERHVYREVHTGAELWERPGLTALREAVRKGEVKAIIAYALDRLSRNQTHIAILDDECERAGVALLFVTEEFDKTPVGKLIRSVKGFAAELEREKIRERSIRGRRAIAQSGKLHNSGIDLYGYRRDRTTRTRTIHEEEAAVVRRIFRWIGEERVSIRQVVARLNAEGIPSPAAGKAPTTRYGRVPFWGSSTIGRMLRNPAYKGEGYGWRYHDELDRKMMRPREEWIPLAEGVSPAIVSAELWQLVHDRLDANVGAETRNQKHQYLLRGLIRCAVCGLPMYSSPNKFMLGGRIYRCSSRNVGHTKCAAKQVPADAIEKWAWGKLDAAIRDPDLIARKSEQYRQEGPGPSFLADLGSARKALAKLNAYQERLVRRLRDAGDEDQLWDLLEREISSAEREKAQHMATIAEIEARLAQQAVTDAQLATLAEYCSRVAANLDNFGFAEKRLAFEAFRVMVYANGVEKLGQWWLTGDASLEGDFGDVFRQRTWWARPARSRARRTASIRRVCAERASGSPPADRSTAHRWRVTAHGDRGPTIQPP